MLNWISVKVVADAMQNLAELSLTLHSHAQIGFDLTDGLDFLITFFKSILYKECIHFEMSKDIN